MMLFEGGEIEARVDFDIVLEPDEHQELRRVTKKSDSRLVRAKSE